MELHQVRYFLATCETLNFTKAAEASHITQPALTKALKLLEEELGGELFDRQSRPMRLTELGRHLKLKFRALHNLTTDISAQAKLFSNLDNAIYTFGLVSTIGDNRFLQIIEALQIKAPGIGLTIRLIPHEQLVSDLREGALELAIITQCNTKIEGLTLTPLYDENYFLSLPAGHPLLKKDMINLEDLHNIDYIHRTHCELNPYIETLLKENQITLTMRLSTDQDAIAQQMVQAGLGASIMPKSLCENQNDIRPFVNTPFKRTITLAHLANRSLSSLAQTVKNLITKQELLWE